LRRGALGEDFAYTFQFRFQAGTPHTQIVQQETGHAQGHLAFAAEGALYAHAAQAVGLAGKGRVDEDAQIRVDGTGDGHHFPGRDGRGRKQQGLRLCQTGLAQHFGLGGVAVDGRTLSVTGHAVGRATVTLTDLPSDERVEIAVTVVDFYLCLFVSAGTDDDRTVLRRNDGLFLWANDVCEYRLVRNTAHEWWGQFLEYDELQRGTYALSDDGTTLVLTSADGIGDTAFAVEAGTLPPKRFAAIMTEGASALPEEDTPLYLQLTERTSGESFYCRLAPELFYQESASDR